LVLLGLGGDKRGSGHLLCGIGAGCYIKPSWEVGGCYIPPPPPQGRVKAGNSSASTYSQASALVATSLLQAKFASVRMGGVVPLLVLLYQGSFCILWRPPKKFFSGQLGNQAEVVLVDRLKQIPGKAQCCQHSLCGKAGLPKAPTALISTVLALSSSSVASTSAPYVTASFGGEWRAGNLLGIEWKNP
jgi:hypothetical protein